MTDYFNLLRQHQHGPSQQNPPQRMPISTTENDDDLLISEEYLPSQPTDSVLPLEDDLLCEEEESIPEADTSPPQANPLPHSAPALEPGILLPDAKPDDTNFLDDKEQISTHIAQWLQSFITMIYAMFRHSRQHEPHDMKPLEKHVINLLVWLERDTQLINSLELELEQADFKQYAHNGHDDLIQLVRKSVMMLLYCLKTTAELKAAHDTRIRLVMASVLQHIGMAQIPPDILSKKSRLSPDELAEIREAPARGKAYLQSCGIEDEYLLRAANESNERVDGSGPRGLQGKNICYSARLIGLLSMFEAMIHVRSYRKRMLPREAVRVVVQKFKSTFERAMLKALLDAILLYPIGSFVKLNSKEVGKVISCHPRLPLRPKVRITMDEYGNDIPPRTIDLKQHPNLMIEQCAYEDDIQTLLHEEKM